jgi:hypothetical protein
MEFGTQSRQDTLGDATPQIDPPALRVTPRDAVSGRQAESTGYEAGFDSMGRGLGAVFQGIMEGHNQRRQEQEQNETIARQHLQVAVNQEDEKLKRTGWAKTLFGENPRYALAQQMAVEQRIKQDVMQLHADIDKYTDVHPSQFRDVVLKENLDRVLGGYEEDPEMRGKLAKVWHERVPQLVENQYKAWFANAQQQTFDRAKGDVTILADEVSQMADTYVAGGDEDKLGGLYNGALEFLENRGTELGMEPLAWRRATLEATQVSLTEGNKNLYDMMKHAGKLDDLNVNEQRAMNTAIQRYDTNFRQQVDTLFTEFDTDMQYVETLEEGLDHINTFLGELSAAGTRATGTEHSQLTLQRGERNAARWQKRLRREMESKLRTVAGNEVKADQQRVLDESWFKPQAERLSTQASPVFSVKDKEQSFDRYIMQSVLEPLGIDVSDEYSIGSQVFSNPDVAEKLSKKLVQYDVKSPLVANMLGQFAGSWREMYDERGRPTEFGSNMLRSVERLRANGVISNYMDTEDAKDLEFITTRMMKGMSPIAIEKDYGLWKTSRTDAVSGVNVPKGSNKRAEEINHVKGIAKGVLGQDIDNRSANILRDQYFEGLRMYDNDHNKATNYVRSRLEKDAPVVNGQVVFGGKAFSKFTVQGTDKQGKSVTEEIDLETVLNKGYEELIPYLTVANQMQPERARELFSGTRLQDQQVIFSTQFGDDDNLYMDYVGGAMSVPIPRYVLESIANKVYTQQQIKNESEASKRLRELQWENRMPRR